MGTSIRNEFASEEVISSYTYPKDYGVKGIAEQVSTLILLFPELKRASYDENIATQPLPMGAEGWFAIPRWKKLGSTYGEAVDKVLATIGSKRRFYNYREGMTGPDYHLRQHVKTARAFRKLSDEQKGHDILIIPCQFGLRHRGRSVRRAREVMNAVEFGLGVFAIGCMILSHPEREMLQWEQIHVDCAGDVLSLSIISDDDSSNDAPHFRFGASGVEFSSSWDGGFSENYGSASGFLA